MRSPSRAALTALSVLCALGSAPAAAQETVKPSVEKPLSATIEIVSDYRFRGVSLSDRKPALQAEVEYTHSSGLFAGTWGSTLAGSGGPNAEIDLYAGYSGTEAGLTYTVTALKYLYPGSSDLTYVELQSEVEAEIGLATVKVDVAYTPQQKNAVDSIYSAAEASFEGPHGITVLARGGRENGAYRHKWDWELGLRRAFGPLAVRASYVGANHRASNLGKVGKPTLLVAAGLIF